MAIANGDVITGVIANGNPLKNLQVYSNYFGKNHDTRVILSLPR